MPNDNVTKARAVAWLYQWSLDEWDREVMSGLSRLRALDSTLPAATVRMFEAMTSERQRRLGRALVRRFHVDEAKRRGEGLSPAEVVEMVEIVHQVVGAVGPAVWATADKAKLRAAVKDRLSQAIGPPSMSSEATAVWTHSARIEGFTLLVTVDTGGGTRQVEYDIAVSHAGERWLEGQSLVS